MGCILIADQTFCAQVSEFLKSHRGFSITAIGDLSVDHLL
jgi:hypothetical protein